MIRLSMFRARPLTFLVCSVLLLAAGCYTINLHSKAPVCDLNIKATHKCLFILEITQKIDKGKEGNRGWVFGRVPEDVIRHNAEHSARTGLGGAIGFELSEKRIRRFEYKFEVDGLDRIEERVAYKFESVIGDTVLKWVGSANYPKDYPTDHPAGYQPRESKAAQTQLYASHSRPCCMCSTCKQDCVCPGEGGCPWCATVDVTTLLARLPIHKDTVDIRSSGDSKHSNNPASVSEKFLALMSGSSAHGNVSAKLLAGYTYDRKFAPVCLTKSA